MLVVRVGVHEGLDHGNHSQERKRRDAGRETQKEENRDRQLLHHGDACRDGRIQQRDAILLLKQSDREFPGLVFQQARLEERGPDADASGELNDRQREAREPDPRRIEPCDAGRVNRGRGQVVAHR